MPDDIPLAEQIEAVRSCLNHAEDTVYNWRHRQNSAAYLQAKREHDALQAAYRTLTGLKRRIDEAAREGGDALIT